MSIRVNACSIGPFSQIDREKEIEGGRERVKERVKKEKEGEREREGE